MRVRPLIAASTFVAALVVAPSSFADVPPQDSCQGQAAGSSCDNAGPNFDEDGVCTNATCRSGNPLDDGGTYPCMLCQLAVDSGNPTCPDGGCSTDAAVPINACPIENLGQSCNNAGPNADERGVCATGPCDDGSTCSLCQLSDAGTKTSADAGHTTTSKDAGHEATGKDAGKVSSTDAGASSLEGSSGCSTATESGGGWSFGLGLGIVGLALSRRRKGEARQ